MAALPYSVFGRVDDADNKPISGGFLRVYVVDTTSLASLYSNPGLTVALTNPVEADSAGRLPPIFIGPGTYDLALLTAGGALVDAFDDFEVPDISALDNILFSLEAKTGDYTVTSADSGKVLDVNADSAPGASIVITAESATLGNGFVIWINNVGTTGSVTVTPDGGETIDGASSWVVAAGERVGIVSRGAAGWRVINYVNPAFDAETLGQLRAIRTVTDSATLALTDAGKTVEMNSASAKIFTIPTNASVAFPNNTYVNLTRYGSGALTVKGDTGVTLNGVSAGTITITPQYGGATIYKRDTNEWIAPNFTAV